MRWVVLTAVAAVLALAGGIALGTGVLDTADPEPASAADVPEQPRTTDLDAAARSLEEAAADGPGAAAVTDRLAGRNVLLVTLPEASEETVADVAASLADAGAITLGQVALTERLLDPAERQYTAGVAREALADVDDVATDGLADYDLVGAALARGLVAPGSVEVDAPAGTVVDAFDRAGLIAVEERPTRRAGVLVVVTGNGRGYDSGRGELLSTVLGGLDAADVGTLVAGPVGSGRAEGAVGAVRSGPAAAEVSTVDAADLALGRVSAIVALSDEVGGTSGHYGTAPGADAVLPALAGSSAAPTAAPSP
ncbi:copper transporter [Mumia flava]|nr:copper transporter [Mumia flava]